MNYRELYEQLHQMHDSMCTLFQDQLRAKDQQLQELTNRIKELSDRIDYLTRQHYGSKSEKSRTRLPNNALSATGAPSVILPDNPAPVQPTAVESPTPVKWTSVERRCYSGLCEVEIELPAAPHPPDATFIGYKTSTRFRYIPATIEKVIYKRTIYVKEDVFYIPELPDMPLDKCQAEASLLAAILTHKYRYHLPLERQLSIFQSLGVDIAKSTFNNWTTKNIDLLKPLTDELHKIIRQSNYLDVDETTLPIMIKGEDKCRKGYVWGITADKENLVWFHYNNGSRSQQCLEQILENYRGTIQSDSYNAYHLFDKGSYKHNVLRLSCLAHIRRKIFESLSTDPRGQQLFDLINAIYHHEHLWQQENQERGKSGRPPLTAQQISQIRKR